VIPRLSTLLAPVHEASPTACAPATACRQRHWPLNDLQDTLDGMHDSGEHFMGRYVMCSSLERYEGGQGLVQFCRHVHSKEEYAIKCESILCKLLIVERPLAAVARANATLFLISRCYQLGLQCALIVCRHPPKTPATARASSHSSVSENLTKLQS
jgi:hypothetical protein